MIHAAAILEDLRVPPGNRLEALKGNRKGRRGNAVWRVIPGRCEASDPESRAMRYGWVCRSGFRIAPDRRVGMTIAFFAHGSRRGASHRSRHEDCIADSDFKQHALGACAIRGKKRAWRLRHSRKKTRLAPAPFAQERSCSRAIAPSSPKRPPRKERAAGTPEDFRPPRPSARVRESADDGQSPRKPEHLRRPARDGFPACFA